MKRAFKAILVMAAAAGLAGVLAAPVQAAASPGGQSQTAQPVSSVGYDEGGLHVTVLKYAAGVAPSSVVAGPCSISQAIGFGVEAGGQYVVYCFDGHGTLRLDLYNVETFFSYENASGVRGHEKVPVCGQV
ncbi:MAG TPA: hypothetical protein VGI96_43485 [Streptosporangiaceae bacterium]|jgi:hypothetical protein